MDLLVSTEWLAQNIGAAKIAIVDASAHLPSAGRDPAAEFMDGHIPGARYLDLPSLKDESSPVPGAIPTKDQLETRLRDLGIHDDDLIVLYDDSGIKSSARAWFILGHYGHNKVAVLDGGLGKWKAEGHALEAGSSASGSGTVSLGDSSPHVRTKADMLSNIECCVEQVIDARDAGRFTGEMIDTVHNLPGGHIPGARNLWFADLLAEDGTFRPREQLAEAFARAGIDIDQPIAASCGSGVTASVVLFALALLGRQGALYDGSWSEWGADPATPKETGVAA